MVFGFVPKTADGPGRLGDYVAANVSIRSAVEGVGDVTLFGSQYAMRIWLIRPSCNLTDAGGRDHGHAGAECRSLGR
jgi:hypothetical protein